MVNMLGKRFYDETGGQFIANNYNSIEPYVQGSYLNAKNIKYNPNNWLNAALAGIGDGHNGGGPIWAIFDGDAVAREKLAAEAAECRHRRRLLLQRQQLRRPRQEDRDEISARADAAGQSGSDRGALQFICRCPASTRISASPSRLYKIAKPPFYAAWATPVVHDTRAGLRINAQCQVIDMNGEVIPGLYCGGESAGGFSQHGLARAACQGFIAGKAATLEAAKS